MDSGESRRLWQSSPPHYEYTSSILSDFAATAADPAAPITLDNLSLLASRESVTEPPQVCAPPVAAAAKSWAGWAELMPGPGPAVLSFVCSHGAAPCSSTESLLVAPPALPSSSCSAALPPPLPLAAAQFFIKTFTDGGARSSERAISAFPHPYPALRDLQKEIIRYNRASDGLELNGTLYLPPGYDAARDGPLPTLLWAYPRE